MQFLIKEVVDFNLYPLREPLKFVVIVKNGGNRQWLEPCYYDQSITPIGNLKTLVPCAPHHHCMLLDACLSFAPVLFKNCPSLDEAKKLLANQTVIDFDLSMPIPDDWFTVWQKLRQEAMPYFKRLYVIPF